MTLAQILTKRFPNSGLQEIYRNELIRICDEFANSGHADRKYAAEFALDDSFWACVTEALVYQRLKNMQFGVRDRIGLGPDFLVLHENKRVWIEVTCPKATGIPGHWQDVQGGGRIPAEAMTVPHTEILLRWTAAIKEKMEKLHGRSDGSRIGYIDQEIVSKDDVYVIAVNGCLLRRGGFPAFEGISRFPYAVEAVFPIGPLGFSIDPETMKIVDSLHQERHEIEKGNGSSVPAFAFLDPVNNMVSAIWALDLLGAECVGQRDRSAVIHNPNASNPLSRGFLHAEDEYGALREDGGDYAFVKF